METLSYTDVESWLVGRVASLSKLEPHDIPVDQPLAAFGLDSAVMVTVTQELSRWLGRDLSITLLWEFPTISELARNLAVA